jgi:hypothetical protein
LFGRARGIGNLTFIGCARAAFVGKTEKALAIYHFRTLTGVDSRSGLKMKEFFGVLDGQLDASEGTIQAAERDSCQRIFARSVRIAMKGFKTVLRRNLIALNC